MKADTDQRPGPMGRMAGRLGKAGPAVGASIVRSRLFIKYVALLVAVVVLALLANGAFEIWFSYQEHKASLIGIQREQAEGAAVEDRAVHHRDRKPGRLDDAIAVVGLARSISAASTRCGCCGRCRPSPSWRRSTPPATSSCASRGSPWTWSAAASTIRPSRNSPRPWRTRSITGRSISAASPSPI